MKTNRRLIHLITPLLFVLSILATAGIALAGPPVSSGSSYEIFRAVEAGAGASSSAGYQLLGLAGEPSSLDSVSSASYSLRPGYRLAAGAGAGTPPTLTAFSPVTNTIAAPLDSSVVLTYSAAMSSASVTSQTVAVHSMMQGLITGTHSVNGAVVTVDPGRNFFPGELVYAVATTQTTNINGTQPLSATQWQFAAAAGAGPATFDAVSNTFGPSGDETYSLALGDVDGDGDLDAAVGNFGEQNVVYLNNGDGSFAASGNTFGPGNDRTNSLALGDVDGDGDLDAAVGNFGGQSVVYLNNGDGSFAASGNTFGPSSDTTNSVALGDVDGDGDLDAAVGNHIGQNVVYLNNGDGSFAASGNNFGPSGDKTYSVALGDVDGDGDLDAAVGNYGEQNVVYLNNGDGTFAATGNNFGTGSDFTFGIVLGDVDGDGDLDAAVGNEGGQNVVYLNNGDGSFAASGSIFGPSSDATSIVALGDVDGDGDLDAAVGNDYRQNMVYLNNGDGTFAATGNNFGTGSDFTFGLVLGDVDGDGDLDVAVGNSGQNAVWLNEPPPPNVTLGKTVTPTSAKPGDSITYTLTFSNAGTGTATGVVITDSVPVSVTNPSVAGSSGAIITQTGSAPHFVWDVADLAPDEGGVITLTGTLANSLATGDVVSNTAQITTIDAESDDTNNSSAAGLSACAPTVTVTNSADAGTGSLRWAVASVCPNGTVNFDAALNGSTITLTSGEITIDRNLTIDGPGAANITVSGDDTYRLFNISAGEVTIHGLTLQQGYTANDGGAIYAAGDVTITDSLLQNNVSDGDGGALYLGNGGTLDNVLIQGNIATDGEGGGIVTYGPLTVTNSVIDNNEAGGGNGGGGIMTEEITTVISGTIISNNRATYDDGGGICTYDTGDVITIINSSIIGNYSVDDGGGMKIDGALAVISNTLIAGNTSDSNGGAISLDYGPDVTIVNSTLSGNQTVGTGGGLEGYNATAIALINTNFISNTAGTKGGGFYNYYRSQMATVIDSVFVGNRSAGGGEAIYNSGGLEVTNSLLAGNGVTPGGAAITMDRTDATLILQYTTIASATLSTGDAIAVVTGALTATNNIIAHYATGINSTGTVSEDYNLFAGNTTDRSGVTPGANSLSGDFNDAGFVDAAGGNFHLNGVSLALNKGTDVGITTDFDGDARPSDSGYDLGYDETTYTNPTAVDDPDESTIEDIAVTLSPLTNDSDANGDTLSISAVGNPVHGAAAISGSTQLVYTPTLNYSGTDVFTYTASDGSLTDTATITVTVSGVNDAPVAVDDPSESTSEDTPLTISPLSNDTDTENDTLSISAISNPVHGTAVISGTTQLVYTPTLNYNGTDVFIYTASDGTLTDTATITVAVSAVNDAPVAVDDSITFLAEWGSNGSGDGQFDSPGGVAVDSSGNVYVADTRNHRIQKFDSSGSFVAQWGSNGSGDGQFNFPEGVAVDSSGNVYVADTYNHRIQKFNSSGAYVNQWGSYGSGDGQFHYSEAVAVDNSGNVYVADSSNNRIQKFNSSGAYVSQWGSYGSGDGQFDDPKGVAVDSSGNVYVAEIYNHRIQKFDSSGTFVAKWGSNGTGAGQLHFPWSVAVDSSGNVYVVDNYNNRIQKFDSNGAYVSQWGSNGSGAGQFDDPEDVAVDSSGNVYVVDTWNYRIQKFSTSSPISKTSVTMSEDGSPTPFDLTLTATDPDAGDTLTWSIATQPISGTATASGTGLTQTIGYTPPTDWYGTTVFTVAVSDGTLSDTVAVSVTVQNTNDAPVAVDDPSESTSEDTPLTISPLRNDSDVDNDTLSISAVSSPANGTAVISGSTQIVYTPAFNFVGTDVFSYTASDSTLTDIATITVVVSAVNDAPQIFDETPTLVSSWGSYGSGEGQFGYLYGIGVDSQGNVYVPDYENYRIQKFDSDGNFISAWGWGVATGSNSYEICTSNCQAGISGSGNGQFDYPYYLAIDSQDQVYVADYYNNRIQKFSSDGTYLAQWSSFNNGDALSSPDAIAIDTQDNVYVGDDGNYRVVKFDSSGTYQTEWDASDSDNGDFDSPYGIDVDCNGNVYVYDYGYYNVQKFDSSGNFLLSWDATDSANGEFSDVNDIVADCQGNVYVPDYDYDNIQKFDSSGTYLEQWPIAGSPVGMTAIDSNGYFYVTDSAGSRILKYGLGETAVTMSEDGSPTAFDLTLTAFDAEDDTLTWSIATQPISGTATASGAGITKTIGYTPPTDWHGTTVFTVAVSDGTLDDTVVISVTVESVNDAPTAVDDPSESTSEDTPLTISPLSNDSDIDGDSLTISAVGAPQHGTTNCQLSIVNCQSSMVYTPTLNYSGTDVFTYTASDGSLTDTATISITVSPVNDAPAAANATDSIDEDSTATGTLVVTDADSGDTFTYTISSQPLYGAATINQSGGWVYTPTNRTASYSVTLTALVADSSGLTGSAVISVAVTANNDSLLAANDSGATAEDTAISQTLTITDSDSNDSYSYVVSGGPSYGTASVDSSGTWVYTPTNRTADYSDVFTVTVTDGGSNSDTATVTVAVTTSNVAPVLANTTRSVAEDAPNNGTVGLPLAATDADGDTLSYSITGGNSSGLFGIGSSSGQLTVADNSGLDYESTTQYVLTVAATDGSLTGTATITVSVTNTNDNSPVLADASRSVAEDAANGDNVGAALSATDADGDSLSYSISGGNTGNVFGIGSSSGQLSVANNLSLDYETTPQYILTVAATDGLFTATASVTVTVTDVAEAITAVDDAVSTAEDAPVTIFALSNDLDPGGQGLTITAVGVPQHGATNCQLSMANCQSSITYTPDPDFHGTDVFTYTAASGQLRDTATVTVTVNSANDRPVAVDDSLSSAEDVPLTFSPLPNDSDPDGDSLSIVSAGPATLGVVTIVDTQTLRYTPPANYSGPDSLVYTISDEQGQTASAKVSLDVTAVNDAPDAVADSATTNEDQSVTIDLLLNDSDVESDTLTISSLDPAHHGTVSDNGDGTVTYTPAPNYHGSDSFAYSLSDGQGGVDKAPVDVTVTPVNDAPQANDDSAVSPDGSAITIDLLGNDSDADGDSLSISSVSQGSQGSAANNGNGTATYTPNAGASGLDSFSYQISDGNGGTATATVQVIIQPQAGLVTAVDDHGTTYEERPLAIDVLANDQSSSGASLSLISVTAPQHGTATYGSNGQVIYSPAVNFHGIDQFSYAVGDGGSGYATAAISVTVLPVNDPPDAVDDSDATNEDTVVTLDVLANDSDPDGDSLAIVAASQPAHGTVVLSGTQLLYRPQAGYAGADNFSYTLGDGQGGLDTAAVNLTVTAVNDPPDAVADTATTAEDTPVSINVLFNDTDPEGDPLNVSAVTQGQYGTVTNNNDGTVVYRPGKDYNGQDAFTYSINDGVMTDTATVRVTITPVEDDPTPVQDAVSTPQDTPVRLNPADNDLDAEGRSLCPAQVGQPAHGAVVLNPDCSVVYTPQSGYSGTDHFTYTLQSGVTGSGLSVFASVKIGLTTIFVNVPQTVNAGADTPTTAEDTPVVIAALSNDSGGGGTLSLVGVSQPAHGTVIISGTNLIYTPDLDYSGSDSFDYTASDGGGYGIGNVSVTVTPVNDAPNARDDSATTNEEQAVTIDLLGNDSDRDSGSGALTISDVTYGQHGAVDDNLDGTVTYTPEADYYGSDSFAYTIDDGSGSSDRAVVEVTVSNTNDDPVANQDIVQTNEDVAVIISPLRNDWDVDADSLSLSGNSSPAHGTATLSGNGDGTVTYTPDPDFFGSDSFTCTVDDGQGGSGVATVWLTVSPVNDAPQANDDSASLNSGAATVDVLANDSDVDGDQLVVTAIGPAGQGAVVNHGDGTVTYSAGAGFNGSDVFTYTVEDAHGATATAQVDIGGQAGGEGSTLYLPLLMRQQSSGPDLVIDSLSATENGVTLVIRNRGNAPVDDAFWVDVYFDPNQPPTVNQPWPDLAAAGLVWGVTQSLSPGESLTLTSGGAYFDAVRSSSPPFAVGATVYAYVDSVDFSSSHGAVQESSEDNNRFGPETVTAGGSAAASEWSGGPVDWDRLPGR